MNLSLKTLGVYPIEEFEKRLNLFKSFEHIFPVHFIGSNKKNVETHDAKIVLDPAYKDSNNASTLQIHEFVHLNKPDKIGFIKFGNDNSLDYRLRNRSLNDKDYNSLNPIEYNENSVIMASLNNMPVWVRKKNGPSFTDTVSVKLNELQKGESLRTYLIKNGFFSLIPLIHFLREVTSELSYRPPPLRASFIIDDANPRFLSYGGIKYNELVNLAKQHSFHVSLASVPIDLWWTPKHSVKFFGENKKFISISVHGNDHSKNEFARQYKAGGESAIVSKVFKRIYDFEKKTSLHLSRVFIPPYGKISKDMLSEIGKFEFDSICAANQFQYLFDETKKITNPEVAEFYPADFIFGMPVIARRFPPVTKGEILLTAFLDIPIIIRYHPWQLMRNYDNIFRKAKFINSFGKVQWLSLENIALTNFYFRKEENLFKVKLFSKRVNVTIPDGVDYLKIEVPPLHGLDKHSVIFINDDKYRLFPTSFGSETEPIFNFKKGNVSIAIRFYDNKNNNPTSLPGANPWALARRFFSELRDRVNPITSKFNLPLTGHRSIK